MKVLVKYGKAFYAEVYVYTPHKMKNPEDIKERAKEAFKKMQTKIKCLPNELEDSEFKFEFEL